MIFSKSHQPSPDQIQQLTRLFADGRLDELIEQTAGLVRRFPKAAQLHNILSVAYNAAGDYHDAVTSAEQAIRIQPDYAKAFLNLGNALANLGEQHEALNSYRQAALIAPDLAEAHNNLGAYLVRLSRHEEAVASFNMALEINPDYIKAYNNLGCALIELGRSEDAIVSLNAAIALNPDYAEAHNNLGGALLDVGRKQEAIASFTRAIEINPYYTESYRQLADLTAFKPDEPLYAEMVELFASDDLTDTQRMHLCFGLAKAEDDIGDSGQCFHYLQEGNHLRKQLSDYAIDEDRALFRRIKSAFSMTVPKPPSGKPASEYTPVFIVGMPRSGTTLVEQILSCHSMVHAAGEVPTLDHGLNSIDWNETGVDAAQLNSLRKYYLTWLKGLNVGERYVTDKTTINFRWIGFILQAMPEARIIHIQRDARATCWSIFTHFFEADAHGYGYDLDDLAAYYKLYVDLMAFWEQRFPGHIHHINYETLTEAQEEQTRKLLEYCGLGWEEQCMDFHLSGRAVATASSQQVRKKMYQGSSDVWRKYEAYLQPLIRQLEGY